MCNKYLLLVLMFLITGNILLSQNIKIEKFYTDPFDISARTNTRKDLNGKNCALLKIQFVGNITDIEGNVIGEPIKQSNAVKKISFYNTIKNLIISYTQNILNSYSAEDILSDISSTLLPYLITDFCIDWCFNTNKRNEATMPPFIKILYNQSSIKEVKK